MDSVTQFALGAGVGAAVLGKRIGPRKAALTGGLLGTLPDLDVLVPFDDPIDAFTLHRGASHSFFVQALVTPFFGEALVRLCEGLRDQRLRAYLAVYLIFVTHAIIDALTIYGTRVFWPLFPEALGSGSIFIIDPLYTLPLLVVTIWAFFKGTWSARFAKALTAALILSTAYLGWGLAAQQVMERRAEALLAEAGIYPERLLGNPTPFNTLFWKVIAIEGDRYINLYMPFFGGREKVTAYVHPRGIERLNCLEDLDEGSGPLAKLAAFTDGYFRLEERGGEIRVTDLRMGLTPNYVFSFAIARQTPEGAITMVPERRDSARRAEGDLDWLGANLSGTAALRPAEAQAFAELRGPLQLAAAEATTLAC